MENIVVICSAAIFLIGTSMLALTLEALNDTVELRFAFPSSPVSFWKHFQVEWKSARPLTFFLFIMSPFWIIIELVGLVGMCATVLMFHGDWKYVTIEDKEYGKSELAYKVTGYKIRWVYKDSNDSWKSLSLSKWFKRTILTFPNVFRKAGFTQIDNTIDVEALHEVTNLDETKWRVVLETNCVDKDTGLITLELVREHVEKIRKEYDQNLEYQLLQPLVEHLSSKVPKDAYFTVDYLS